LRGVDVRDTLAERMRLVRRPTFWDGTLLVLLLVLTFSLSGYSGQATQGTHLVVRTPDGSLIYDLARNGIYPVSGPLGTAKLIVQDGKADLENAPCPLKICESMGPVGKAGEAILCLPNRISVKVTGEVSIDAVTR
jgi:hypothetical protein